MCRSALAGLVEAVSFVPGATCTNMNYCERNLPKFYANDCKHHYLQRQHRTNEDPAVGGKEMCSSAALPVSVIH